MKLESDETRLLLKSSAVAGWSGLGGAAFVLTAVVTARQLGPSRRGELVLYITVVTLSALVASLGVHIAARVLLVREHGQGASLDDYLGFLALAAPAAFLLCAVFVWSVLRLANAAALGRDVVTAALYAALYLVALGLRDALHAYGHHARAAALEAFGNCVQLVGVGLLAAEGSRALSSYLLVLIGGPAVQCLLSAIHLHARVARLRVSLSLSACGRLVRFGVPGLLLAIFQSGALRLDRLLAAFFLTTSAVGIYSVAATASEVLWLLPVAAGQVLLRQRAAVESPVDVQDRVRSIVLAATTLVAVVGIVTAGPAVRAILGPAYGACVTPLRVLLVAAIFLASYHVDALLLCAQGEMGRASRAALGGVVTITVLDMVLIPRAGTNGAAWASAVGYALMALMARASLATSAGRSPPSGTRRRRVVLVTTVPITFATFYRRHVDAWRDDGWQLDVISGEAAAGVGFVVPMRRRPLTFQNFVAVPRLARLLRRLQPDVVIVSTPVAAACVRAAACFAPRVRVAYIALGFDFGRPRTLPMLPYLAVERCLALRTDMLAVVNEDDRQEVATWRRPLAPRLRGIVPSLGLEPLPHRGARMVNGFPMIGVLAELTPRKQVGLAIEASSHLGRPHLLVVGGTGPEERKLRALAARLAAPVRFDGWIDDASRWLAQLEVLVLCSRREGLPHCVIQAMMLGVPVVGTDVRGTRDLLRGGAGILVEPQPEAIAHAVSQAVDPATDLRPMLQTARDRALRYAWPVAHRELTDLVETAGACAPADRVSPV